MFLRLFMLPYCISYDSALYVCLSKLICFPPILFLIYSALEWAPDWPNNWLAILSTRRGGSAISSMAEDAGVMQVQRRWRWTCIEPASVMVTRNSVIAEPPRDPSPLPSRSSTWQTSRICASSSGAPTSCDCTPGQYTTAEVGTGEASYLRSNYGNLKDSFQIGWFGFTAIVLKQLYWYNYIMRPG